MQLVKTTRDTLLRPLQIVSGIVERRHTMPILANILIRKDGENVSFLSTDTEVQITTHANIGSGDEVAGTTVAARKLLDILRALPESGDVTMTLQNKRLTVQTGKSRFALQTLAAEEFPTVLDRRHLQRHGHAAAKDAQAPVQHGALLDGAAGHPLLPERPAAGARRQQRDCRGDRRPPPGLLPGGNRTGVRRARK